MLSLTLSILFIILQNAYIFASYCGEDAIPFSLQILQSGQPVLGCARPSCFGWGVKTDRGARFYRIKSKNDGFLRHNNLKKNDKAKIVARKSQLAFCEKNYASISCDEKTQWVGGLSPTSNVTAKPLLLKCCTFDNLKNSSDRGIANVHPGQIVVGGEVLQDERQYAFDYIANVKKYFTQDDSVAYSVAVRRFWCLPYPTKSKLHVEENALSYIMNRMGTNHEGNYQDMSKFKQSSSQFGDKIISETAVLQQSSPGPYPGSMQIYTPLLYGLPVSPVMMSTTAVSPANHHHSNLPFNINQQQHPDISPIQLIQLPVLAQQTQQQLSQQPFIFQQHQQQQSAMQTFPEPNKSQPFLSQQQLYQQQQQQQQQYSQQQQSAFPEQDKMKSEQSQQQHHPQSLLYERQKPEQPVQQHLSQFPTFPSFNNLAFSLP